MAFTVPDKSFFTIRYVVGSIPTGRTVTSCKFYCKTAYSVADGSATFNKTGTVDLSGANGTAIVEFAITPTETTNCTIGTAYVVACKLFFDNSTYYTPLESQETFTVVQGGIDQTS